jgi:hypothetical protein
LKKIILLVFCFCFIGCAARHVSEIRTLQALGANAQEQQRYTKEKNKKFEELLAVIQSNQMSSYTTQQDFLKAFGAPIFEKNIDQQEAAQMWLYRYCEKMQGSEKVYLYFDASGKLLTWEHKPAEAK